MFNGIINKFCYLKFYKYIYFSKFYYFYFLLKINFINFLEINTGDSVIIEGLCLTLIYKYLNFLEFELFYETLKFNFGINRFLNIEKSLLLFNNISGQYLYGHININLICKNKFLIFNSIYKLCIFCNINFKNFFIYKSSISINGISLTINELVFYYNYFNVYINIINFTFYITNIKYMKLFDNINIEFDLSLIFIFNYFYNL